MSKVSIVILNYNSPEIINICLRTLKAHTEGVDYEVVVVDNGSRPDVIPQLYALKDQKFIDTLVLSKDNLMFSGGNNLGVANTDPTSDYILLLNSDVAFKRGDWLTKMIGWMEGTTPYEPTVWNLHPTQPKGGKLDIVSIGWSHDAAVEPGHIRPEGWCLLYRREVWRDMSEDFPWHYGMEEQVANICREGHRVGVLFNYAPYLVHAEQGSGRNKNEIVNKRTPDIPKWFAGLEIESLDFTLGPNEHQSYLQW